MIRLFCKRKASWCVLLLVLTMSVMIIRTALRHHQSIGEEEEVKVLTFNPKWLRDRDSVVMQGRNAYSPDRTGAVYEVTQPVIPVTQPVIPSSDELSDMLTRSKVQRSRMDSFCSKYKHYHPLSLPNDPKQKNELYRHLIFDDKEEVIYCFVEKSGCTNMKRLMFVNMGLIPEDTISWEWVDNTIYLEKALKKSSFAQSDLTFASRLQRIRHHFKFMIVRNPLERLVSGYKNKIEPPLDTLSLKFPYHVQREILQMYHTQELEKWLESNASYPLTITFADFVQYLIDKDNADINAHFRPMVDTCHPCEIRYDFYANFRSLSQDAGYIIRKIHAKPEYYRDESLHSKETQTKNFLGYYYSLLPEALRHHLFEDWKSELDFYYHLYPDEKYTHILLLGVNESMHVNDFKIKR